MTISNSHQPDSLWGFFEIFDDEMTLQLLDNTSLRTANRLQPSRCCSWKGLHDGLVLMELQNARESGRIYNPAMVQFEISHMECVGPRWDLKLGNGNYVLSTAFGDRFHFNLTGELKHTVT